MCYILSLLTSLALLPVFLTALNNQNNPTQNKGTIIILNGPSAAGKSSIQNEIQKSFNDLYIKIGIDNFFDAVLPTPDISHFAETKELSQYTNDHVLIRKITLQKDPEGNQIVPLEVGPAGDKVIFGMHSAIAAYAEKGNNAVVDYILYQEEWLPDLVHSLKGYKVYLIKINAPLSLLEEREKKRGTSPLGHARSHYNTVHKNMIYDLELDVANLSPDQSAEKIRQFMEQHPQPTALQQLSQKF